MLPVVHAWFLITILEQTVKKTTSNEYFTGNLHTVVAIAQIRILNISIGFGGRKNVSTKEFKYT